MYQLSAVIQAIRLGRLLLVASSEAINRLFKAAALAPRRERVAPTMAPEVVVSTSPPAAMISTEVTGSKVEVAHMGAAWQVGSTAASTACTVKPIDLVAASQAAWSKVATEGPVSWPGLYSAGVEAGVEAGVGWCTRGDVTQLLHAATTCCQQLVLGNTMTPRPCVANCQ